MSSMPKIWREYLRGFIRSGITLFIACIAFVILKCAGFGPAALFNSDSNEPLSFSIISMLTGEMLLWLIPLTLVLFAVYFAVVRHNSQYACPGGAKIKRQRSRQKKRQILPHRTASLWVSFTRNSDRIRKVSVL